ncbi:MAG: AEC family transporter [Pseudomonadota bacterium]
MFAPLIDPILPVFAIVAIGFNLGRTGRVNQDDARVLNRIAMTLLLPILLFGLLYNAPVQDLRLVPITLYAATQYAIFLAGYALARVVFKLPVPEAILLAMAGVFSNTVLYVMPLSVLLYGPDNVLPMTAIITLDSVVTFAAAIMAMEIVTKDRANVALTLGRLAKSPLLIAMAAGLAVNIAGLQVPAPVMTFVDFNGAAAPPLALFALGVVLAQTPLKPDALTLAFTGIKLIVFPLAIAVTVGWGLGGSQQYVLGAAGPAGAMSFSLALLYGVRTEVMSRVIVYTSVLTLFTLAALA